MKIDTDKIKQTEYYKLFEDELTDLDNMSTETDRLYNETYMVFDKNLQKSIGKTGEAQRSIMGSSSSYSDRNVIEISKSLTSIRQTRIGITDSKSRIKKMIADLNIQQQRIKVDEEKNGEEFDIFRNIMAHMSKNINSNDIDTSSGDIGMEHLENLDRDKLGINGNDNRMIQEFKDKNTGV